MDGIKYFESILSDAIHSFKYSEEHLGDINIELQTRKEELIHLLEFIRKKREEYLLTKEEINKGVRPLNIGVVGGFSTGKSSFINSLLGEDLLGVKVQPATAKITRLSYGENLVIKKVVNGEEVTTITEEEYQKLVNHPDGTVLQSDNEIEEFRINYPNPILSQIHIYDTPGFSSTSKNDDKITKKKLADLDLLIWLFDANKVADKDEVDLIKQYSDKRIIAVINKIDDKQPSARDKIRQDLENTHHFEKILCYSAMKISELNQQEKIHADVFQIIFDKTKELCTQNIPCKLKYDAQSTICLQSNDETIISKELLRTKKDAYSEYRENLYAELNRIKSEIEVLQLEHNESHKRELHSICLNHSEELSASIDNDLETAIRKKENYEGRLEKDKKAIVDKVKQRLSQFSPKFSNNLYKLLFSYSKKEGFFSDDEFISLKITEPIKPDYQIDKYIYKAYKDLTIKCIKEDYEPILEHWSTEESFTELTDSFFEEISPLLININKATRDGINSIISVFINYFGGKVAITGKEDNENFWKKQLDLVTPDEMLHNTLEKELVGDFYWKVRLNYINPLSDFIKKLEMLKEGLNDFKQRIN